jgi:hypothetical protein
MRVAISLSSSGIAITITVPITCQLEGIFANSCVGISSEINLLKISETRKIPDYYLQGIHILEFFLLQAGEDIFDIFCDLPDLSVHIRTSLSRSFARISSASLIGT